jgi:hypothetical protein
LSRLVDFAGVLILAPLLGERCWFKYDRRLGSVADF